MNGPAIAAVIVRGHRVASGLNGDPRFPGGTLRLQTPLFRATGINIDGLHPGTLNVAIAPWRYRLRTPRHTVTELRWHATEPAETFSFIDVEVTPAAGSTARGWIYHPHPETKPEHFQAPDVLELWLPWIPGVTCGDSLTLRAPPGQIEFTR